MNTPLQSLKRPKLSGLLLLSLLGWLSSACVITVDQQEPVTPQRPRFSSNTRTTAGGTVEVEGGIAIDPGDQVSFPVRVKYGLEEGSETYLEWSPYQEVDVADDTERGVGDVLIGYRKRFLEETQTEPAVALQLEAKIPTADSDEGLGTGETDLFVAGAGEKTFDKLRLGGFYELGLLGQVGDGGLDVQHGFAVVGTQKLDSRIEAFGEAAFVWTPAREDEQLFTTLGVNYHLAPTLMLDAAVVVGLSPDAPDFALLVGITQNFGRPYWPGRRPGQ